MPTTTVYAIKKKGESNEKLMHRFKQMNGRRRHIITLKKEKFHQKKKSKRFVRQSAVMRASHRARRARERFYS